MCLPAIASLGSLMTGAAVGSTASILGTAAGATAGAATAGSALAQLGALASFGSAVVGGVSAAQTARANARATRARAQTDALLTATQDMRERRKFASTIRQQAAELIARGMSLDSPTAVTLGDYAAREMSFQSQAIRSSGAATQAELTSQERMYRAQGRQALLTGTLTGAGDLLVKAPEVWPGLRGP